MSSQPVFIPVGALADGFAPESNILAPVNDLSGRTLELAFSDGTRSTLAFAADGTLRADAGTSTRTATGPQPGRVTSVRDGIYFIDYVGGGDGTRPSTTSIVVDVRQGLCTSVTGGLPTESEARLDAFTRVERGLPLTGVAVQIRHGRIVQEGADASAALHAPTTELIGMRNLYTYSPTERYEHIYLNENFYTWQCLAGVEAGLADVDRCYMIGIANKLTLFVWCEKIVPTLGVVMIDLERMKTDGKIFGYQGSNFGALSNFPVGAFAQILNVTRYPE
ncbi:MoaF C-terminal domain-containing protein [Paraburkholderia acidipaludis]|uniref:MoaF C-terminal domain-containing protein n=1 Tax=Paraburkholderia acidipaludis TaxID=660537 RepID=UPI00047F619C|nr:MoaF C-terminal domain-containing protein [Paraburkholderia acidipaludis]